MLKNKKLIIACYFFAYFFMLFSYKDVMQPLYLYMGFYWNPDKLKIFESLFFLLIILLFLPVKFSKPSDFFLHVHFLFPVFPMLVLYGAEGQSRIYTYMTVILFIFIIQVASNVKISTISLARFSTKKMTGFCFVFSWIVIAIVIALGGMKNFNINLSMVYDFRANAAESLPTFFNYLFPLVGKVLLPFSLLFSIVNRNWILASLSVLGGVMLFGLTSHKGPVIYPMVVLMVYFIIYKRNPIRLLLVGYILTLFLSHISFLIEGLEVLGSLIIRRSYFIPADLNYLYFDFFSSNPFYFWSNSKVTGGLISNDYGLPGANIIGMTYFNDNASANTGWIGSGYMHAGYIGMFFYAVIVSFVFIIINSCAVSLDKNLVVPLVIISFLTMMMSSDVFPSVLTHGLGLCLILLLSIAGNRKV